MDHCTHALDPSGSPEPLAGDEGKIGLVGMMTIVLAASGTFFLLGSAFTGRTQGASRSARLRWEARQQAAAEAVRAIQAGRAGERGDGSGGE